ncbi:1,2-phenylacetyl-CoA epoxidase subunit PaaC [Actinokineospora globicatena]|uniref:1,2-phenylacetyl-CoA epoxidase subunit PaaC n=1 Tax=Actinokineospora globicatena TaxID=103729 RepID=UPI0020A3749F|nr:1,2-phenylacetyl-CoA epoxidase subunit PaaC [Actinokineospora globicatena]MCP2301723.1 ring-1,2-phenylacetyl-CoA epoxidase subunit PaaC [Actinokineospora globicatena]GLW76620.1 phenylacetate-CoA oxygenase subunit PaaI [Actinokineospora globicatena]GLW83454.1 phenylacetate-CoA oxygenase subunit PaaI [Actinokineospora globicatena]
MDNAYDGLTDAGEEKHWAFGTGFTAALAGVGRDIPAVDRDSLTAYCLMLGDDALVYSQRLAEWCSRAPELEEDVALANIALDLLGQARLLLSRAAEVEDAGRDEDALAYLRDERQFRNVRLVELDCGPGPGGDFGTTIARLLVFSTWRLAVFQRLVGSADPVLAAVAAKGVKELAYHRDHAAQWVLRLAGGTEYSRERIVAGLDKVWAFTEELFATHPIEAELDGVAVDPAAARAEFDQVIDTVLSAAGLERPRTTQVAALAGQAGRDGIHTEAMGYLLAELQHIARSMPGAVW